MSSAGTTRAFLEAGQQQSIDSSSIKSDLISKGYTERQTSEGVEYDSPSEEYVRYHDKKYNIKDPYTRETYVFDSSGNLLRKIEREAVIDNVSSSGSVTSRIIRQKAVEDYVSGFRTDDPYQSNTTLAESQRVAGEVARGERRSEPILTSQKKALETARYQEQVARRSEIKVGPSTVQVRELRAPTYQEAYREVQKRQDASREKFLSQLSVAERERVQRELAANPNAIVSGVSSRDVGKLNAPNSFVERFGDAGGYAKFIKANSYSRQQDDVGSRLGRSGQSVGRDPFSDYLLRDRNVQTQPSKAERIGSGAIGSIVEGAKSLGRGAQKQFDFFLYGPANSAVSTVKNVKDNPHRELLSYGVNSDRYSLSAAVENFRKSSAQFSRDPDVQAATIAEGGFLAAFLLPPAVVVAGSFGLGYAEAKAGVQSYISGDYEQVGASATNLVLLSAPFAFEKIPTRSNRANAFLKDLASKGPEDLSGTKLYSKQLSESQISGDIIKKFPGGRVVKESSNPVEQRLIKNPVNVLNVAKGKNTYVFTLPDGTQRTTVRGQGKFQDFSLFVDTDASGFSRAKVFEFKTGFEESPFLKSNPTFEFDLLKQFSFNSKQGLKFTEPLPVKYEGGNDFLENQFKANDLTIRQRSYNLESKGVPLSRDGKVPIGFGQTGVRERVEVFTRNPKADFRFQDNILEVQFNPTEFEIVDYPIKQKDLTLIRNFDSAVIDKPTEFTTRARATVNDRFFIKFRELTSPPDVPRIKNRNRPRFENRFLGLEPEPISAGSANSFNGPQAETFNAGLAKGYNSLLENLGKFDPYGLSGDRIRAVNSQESVSVNVQRPSFNFKPREFKLFTDIIPEPAYSLNRGPAGLISKNQQRSSGFNLNRALGFSESNLGTRENLLNVSKSNNILRNLLRGESISKLNIENVSRSRLRNESRSELQNKSLSKVLQQSQTKLLNQSQTKTSAAATSRINTAFSGFQPPALIVPPLLQRSKERNDAYDVYVRESNPKGRSIRRPVKVNSKPLPANAADNLGGFYADNSSARTYYKRRHGSTSKSDEGLNILLAGKFRTPRGKSRLARDSRVERSSFAIDTQGEREQITAKGLRERLRKSHGGLNFGFF